MSEELFKEYTKLLMPYNKRAFKWMMKNHDTKNKYVKFQRTDIWKGARDLVIEYYRKERGHNRCSCGRSMDVPILHHKHYQGRGWFDLEVVTIICIKCNAFLHRSIWT